MSDDDVRLASAWLEKGHGYVDGVAQRHDVGQGMGRQGLRLQTLMMWAHLTQGPLLLLGQHDSLSHIAAAADDDAAENVGEDDELLKLVHDLLEPPVLFELHQWYREYD